MGRHRSGQVDFLFSWSFVWSTFTLTKVVYSRLEWSTLFSLLTIGMAVAREIVNYYSGLNLGKFYSALIGKDEPAFWKVFTESTLLYVALCTLIALVSFFSWCLYLSYRKNVVDRLQNLYFKENLFYRLNCIDDHGVDNPDQRMTQDVERACNLLATKIFPVAFLAPFTIIFYTYKTWIVAGPFGVSIIYGYFILGTLLSRLLLSPIAKWSARVERAEGDFRYKHVSVRDHAEETAFYNAAAFEESECNRLFSDLLWRQRRQVLWRLPSEFFQAFFNYFGGSLSYVIQVFPVFVFHTYDDVDPDDFGQYISNNAFVFIYLINSFTNLTDLVTSVGEFAGYVQRITELIKVEKREERECEMKRKTDRQNGGAYDNIVETSSCSDDDSSNVMELSNLCYAPPSNEAIYTNEWSVRGVTCSLSRCTRLLITGPSGVGKSSLLRCMAGLWTPIHGRISLGVSLKDVIFLPQCPYFPVGRLSLKQQVVFPTLVTDVSEQEDLRIISIIHSLSLARLLITAGDLYGDVDFEWGEQLSLGEQQRLSLARIFFHRPSIVFLDESTSSLSESAERNIYTLLDQAGIGYVSTGHRSTLLQYHREVIDIGSDGTVTQYRTDELRF